MTRPHPPAPRILVCLALLFLTGAVGLAEEVWVQDLDQAKQLARTQKKDLLIDFSGSDWCVWCQRLEREVFSQEAFLKKARKDFIFVLVDFPRKTEQDAALKKRNETLRAKFEQAYGFPGFPTVFLADAEGTVYARTGYQQGGAEAYLKHLDFLRRARPLIDPGATWLEDYEVAKAKAAALGRDLLIDFSGSDWCGWCIRLDHEVFEKPHFKQEAPKDFVLLRLDFPRRKAQDPRIKAQNARLQQEYVAKYSFRGYPTVYLAQADGQPYAMTGYQAGGPEKYVQDLRSLKEKERPREAAAAR